MGEIIGRRYRERAFQVAGLEESEQAEMYETSSGNCKESDLTGA